MKKVVVIDGQGGKMGSLLVAKLKAGAAGAEVYALGTNSIATAAMMKAGADYGATGENPVVAACRNADIIVGPIGIVVADSLVGEISPAMAVAVGQSGAHKVLLPVSRCNTVVAGARELPVAGLIDMAVAHILPLLA